jgi:hypothetical protein
MYFSFKEAVVTLNYNENRKGIRIILNLIHFTGIIQGWGILVMKLSYFSYLGNNVF